MAVEPFRSEENQTSESAQQGIYFTAEAEKRPAHRLIHFLTRPIAWFIRRPFRIVLFCIAAGTVIGATALATRPDLLKATQAAVIWIVSFGHIKASFELPDAQFIDGNTEGYSGIEHQSSSTGSNSSQSPGGGTQSGGSEPGQPGDSDDDDAFDFGNIGPKPTTPPPVVSPPPQTPLLRPIVSSAGFTHPGVLVSLQQLNFTKQKLAAKQAPWHTIYLQAAGSSESIRTPSFSAMVQANDASRRCSATHPSGCIVECGYNNKPNNGCKDESIDAASAYTQALLWYYTGQESYAQSAVTILNAYSRQLKGHAGDNRAVQVAWTSQVLVRAAELIRYTYTPSAGKQSFDTAGFSALLANVFTPMLTNYDYRSYNGNWELSAIDGLINIAVYTDNRSLFNQAITRWRERTQAYIYISSDGATPKGITGTRYINNPTETGCLWLSFKSPGCAAKPRSNPNLAYQHGQTQETCRDFPHTGMGLASLANTAETAYLQGVNLYQEQKGRIMAGFTYNAQQAYTYGKIGRFPSGFCNDAAPMNFTHSSQIASEIAYNAYAIRGSTPFRPLAIPQMSVVAYPGNDPLYAYIVQMRYTTNGSGLISVWETLTHHNVGNGFPF